MAYNSNKGKQHSGDIQYENDPNDTQIDFENDFVALKTNGNQAFVVSGSLVGIGTATPGAHPSGKNDLVIGNQSDHRGITIASGPTSISTIRFTYPTTANNGEGWIDYSNNSKKMRFGTNGLNTRVTIKDTGTDIVGQLSASLGVSGTTGHFTYLTASAISGGSPITIAGDTVRISGDEGVSVVSSASIWLKGAITASHPGTISASSWVSASHFAAPSGEIDTLTVTDLIGGSPLTITTAPDPLTLDGPVDCTSTLYAASHITSSLGVTASYFLATGSNANAAIGVTSPTTNNMFYISTIDNDNRVPLFITNTAENTLLAVTGSGHVIIGGKGPPDTTGKLNVSGSVVEQLISCRADTNAQVFHVSGSGDVFVSGSLGIGTANPVSRLDIDSDSLRLRIPNTPTNASSVGEQGEIRWDANYLYICVATNTWKRVALSTW